MPAEQASKVLTQKDPMTGFPVNSFDEPNAFRQMRIMGLLCVWLLGLALSGCAARFAAPGTATVIGRAPLDAKQGEFWWACRFRVIWTSEKEPDWAVDLLLAHAAVQPVLKEYASNISYWRFHRRAARDGAGHQFSFLFYTDPVTAAEIIHRIEESSIVRDALTVGIVERIVVDDPANPSKPGVEDTSDRHWSPTLQRIWPVYIMGVSSLWLGLINEAMVDIPGTGDEIHGLLDRYRQADIRINLIWSKEGQHALLHHLNAIFGYKPMLIRKEMSF
jgi:hypothetical protein